MEVTRVPIDSLTAHPKNYRSHPAEQIQAIRASIREFGQYRPAVVSKDSVVLGGHGVWEACKAEGHTEFDVHVMAFDASDPRAEKLLVADNELSRMAVDDQTALASLLADIQRTDSEGLQGTGWDDGALDKLVGELAAEDFGAGQLPEAANGKEFDEDLDLSNIKRVTCPECGHEFPL
jgi:hypothetical protein